MSHCDAGDLGIRTLSWEHKYCTVPAWQEKYHCRQSEQSVQGQQQLEAGSSGIQGSHEAVPVFPGRFVCRPPQPPADSFLEPETRSTCRRSRCPINSLEGHECLCISSLSVATQNLEKDSKRRSDCGGGGTGLVRTTLAPCSPRDVGGATGFTAMQAFWSHVLSHVCRNQSRCVGCAVVVQQNEVRSSLVAQGILVQQQVMGHDFCVVLQCPVNMHQLCPAILKISPKNPNIPTAGTTLCQ